MRQQDFKQPLRVACAMLVFGSMAAIGNVVQGAHLVAQWNFDDNGGTTAVSAVNSPADDGTLNGASGIGFSNGDLAPVAGNVSVLSSDGSAGNYVSTAFGGIAGTDARTVSAWIKTTTNGGDNSDGFGIVSWGPNMPFARFGIRLDKGVVRIEHNSGRRHGSLLANTGEWVHIGVTSAAGNDDLQNVKIYVNGILDTVDTDTGGTQAGFSSIASDFEIGGLNVFTGHYADGLIDDVRVYNTELSAAEILVLATPIPEPSSILLCLLGATGLVLSRQKVRRG